MDARHEPYESPALPAESVAPTPNHACDLGGGRSSAPAETPGAARTPESPWAKVVAKGSALFAGMLGLAAIGAWSTMAGAGVPVPLPARPSADAHGAWMAGSAAARSAPVGTPSADAPPPPAPSAAAPAPSAGGLLPDGRVVLNLATAEELRKLPRVGPKRAEAIVELRKKLGKFKKPTDLLRVKGIGPKTLRLMLEKLVVDPPA